MSDAYENAKGLDPNDNGSTDPINEGADGDLDGDGLTNIEEHNLGTDPNNDNTDGDSLLDGEEAAEGRDPCVHDDPPPVFSYTQNFDAFADGITDLADGTTIASNAGAAPGSAQVLGGALQLTADNVNDQRASFRIPALADTHLGWRATFDYTMMDAVGDNPPADGFSFNWGAIPALDPAFPNGSDAPNGHGAAEEGWGAVDHISFEFDVWQPGNPNTDRGVNIATNTAEPFTAADHAFTPATCSGTARPSAGPPRSPGARSSAPPSSAPASPPTPSS